MLNRSLNEVAESYLVSKYLQCPKMGKIYALTKHDKDLKGSKEEIPIAKYFLNSLVLLLI